MLQTLAICNAERAEVKQANLKNRTDERDTIHRRLTARIIAIELRLTELKPLIAAERAQLQAAVEQARRDEKLRQAGGAA